MLMDADYKDMLKSQWGTGSTGSDSSAAHALADAHDDDDVDVVAEPMHVVRRLATIDVSPSDNLQTKLTNAGAGDTLNLADGTYTGSGNYVLEINKDITIRAQNSGQALLDGENMRRVIYITSGTVTLEGLKITRGSTVRLPLPGCTLNFLDSHSLH